MNHGPLIFLGVLASFVASWWGLIFAPQLQIGSQQSAQTDSGLYPSRRAGVAQQGHEVYVAQGCVQCHSQQVRQEGYTFNVEFVTAGTNTAKVAKILAQIAPALNANEVMTNASDKSPQTILKDVAQGVADDAQKKFKDVGAKAVPVFIPLGVDLARGWGVRRTVGADYLYDEPVQVGNSRLGPDLSNAGARMPDTVWHLDHLYDPRTRVDGSIMPASRHLFETRPQKGKQPSPEALKLTGKFAPPAGLPPPRRSDSAPTVALIAACRR